MSGMKIELEKAEPNNLGTWHVHVDGKYFGRFVPKDWQMIEENPISLELIINGRLYLESSKETQAALRLVEKA